MIRHSVILRLKPSLEPLEKQAFFDAVYTLSKIPNVQKFEVLKQVSTKNKFEYGISMEFENQEQYDNYSIHKDHQSFIKNFWVKCVEDFLEIDYTVL
jgi:hypothetical protein